MIRKQQKTLIFLSGAVVLIILILGGFVIYNLLNARTTRPTACTTEAKICPDGSLVVREGANCEFKACPEQVLDETASWKKYANAEYGFEIKYPQDFKTTISSTYSGLLDLTFGYKDTPYIGNLSLSVDKNDKNETPAQYFARNKLEATKGFASKCQTCANMDVDAELYECFLNEATIISVDSVDGYVCENMPQRATYYSPIYIFNKGYIYKFTGYSQEMTNYEVYQQIFASFKFTAPTEQTLEQKCLASGGKVTTNTCYCTETKDFYNNCAIGACTCTPNPQYKKEIKNCDCGTEKCWNGEKCEVIK